VDRELELFLAPRRRGHPVGVGLDGTSSLGHIVEALGVPLLEVGWLTVNGTARLPAYRARAGDGVHVHAVPRPQPLPMHPPRFLLDVHLGALARRLRLLGLNVAYRNDADDDELVVQAAAENRFLLTQDRGLLRRRAVAHGAYVRGSGTDAQLRDVLDRFRPPTEPFSRCLQCNGRLLAVRKAEIAHLLEPGTRRTATDFVRCAECARVFWRGAHARRLDEIVAGLTGGPPAAPAAGRAADEGAAPCSG
jgi:hypothetical protein